MQGVHDGQLQLRRERLHEEVREHGVARQQHEVRELRLEVLVQKRALGERKLAFAEHIGHARALHRDAVHPSRFLPHRRLERRREQRARGDVVPHGAPARVDARHLLKHVVHAEAAHAQGERQLVILGQAVARQQFLVAKRVEDAPADGEARARRRNEAQLVAHDHGAEVVLGELVGVGGRGQRLEEQPQPRHALQREHGELEGVVVVDQVVRHLELVGVHHVLRVMDGDAREAHVALGLVFPDGPHGMVDVGGLRRGSGIVSHHAHHGASMARLERASHGHGSRIVGVDAQKHPVQRARVLRGGHEVVHHFAQHGVLVPGGDDHGQHLRRLLVDERQLHALLARAAKQCEHVPQHVVRAEHNERERNEEADPIDDLLVHARFRLLSSPQLICQLARVKTPSLQFVLGRSPKRGRRQARATMPRSIREEGAGHGR